MCVLSSKNLGNRSYRIDVQTDQALESHAHRYRFCLLGEVGGRVLYNHQHDIRTGSEQSCQEALQVPFNHQVHPHYDGEFFPIRRQIQEQSL